MKQIASRDNPFLKHLRKLLKSSAARREAGETLLDGPHLVATYLDRRGASHIHLAVARSKIDQPEIRTLAGRVTAGQVVLVEDVLFNALSPAETPVGISALIPIPKGPSFGGSRKLLLEGIQDPGNMGALLRTALAAGFVQVYLSPGCADPWSPKCLRGGMGAQLGLSIQENMNLPEVLTQFPGISIACAPRAQHSLYELALSEPLAVIVGAEGLGLSSQLLAAATYRCRIPMSPNTESLNAAVAAAIVMYEHVRQQLMRA